MHRDLHACAIGQRDVADDTIERFHLERSPIGPQRSADSFPGKYIGDLVRLYAVVESTNLVSEFPRDVDHLRHLVGAIAVIVHENVAAQYLGECLVAEVAGRRVTLVLLVPLVPASAIRLGIDPRGAVSGDVAHPGGWTAARVNAFRILTTCHLQSVLGTGELHPLHGARWNDLEHCASSADQVR